MSTEAAELSSIHSALEDLTERIAKIAERLDADPDDPVSAGLFDVDRALRTAVRKLERIRDRL